MNYGFAKYECSINGISIKDAVFKPKHQYIRKVLFSTVEEKILEIKFYLLGVSSKEHINSVVENEIESLLDRFSFEFDMYIGKAHQSALKFFKKNSVNISSQGTCTNQLDGKVKIIRSIKKESIENSTMLHGQTNSSLNTKFNLYLPQYRFALSQPDLVVTFMLLYNILLSIQDDNQTKLDEFVSKVNKDTLQSISPHTKKNETIFTKLRNEIAHNRGVPPINTVKDIQNEVKSFREIVKKAIAAILINDCK